MTTTMRTSSILRNGVVTTDTVDSTTNCKCACHSGAGANDSNRCCSIDIEIASLGRFENVFCAAARMLHEENDIFEPKKITFRLYLVSREHDRDRYVLSHMTTETGVVTANSESDDFDSGDDIVANSDDDDDDSSGYGEDTPMDDAFDEARRNLVDVIKSYTMKNIESPQPKWLSRLLPTIYSARESSSRNNWLAARAFNLANALRYYSRLRRPAETQRLDVLQRLIVLPEIEESTPVNDCTKQQVWLFFQWFRLMATLPVSYDHDMMNFAWASVKNTVRVFVCETAFRQVNMLQQQHSIQQTQQQQSTDATIISCNSVLREGATIEPFTVRDGNYVLRNIRDRYGSVEIMSRDNVAAANVASTAAAVFTDRKRLFDGRMDTTTKRQRITSSHSVVTATSRITGEQRRVLSVLQEILNRDLLKEIPRRELPMTRRRVVVDGVAGAGKTFMLGVLLSKFARVRYLVKKRTFVEITEKRFGYDKRLVACTIDAFLMRHLNIRDLPTWLHARATRPEKLLQQLMESPVPRDDTELIFVDEYSLIEGSLAELLCVALINRMTVVVGDCNQQSAIGDSTDRPVRTLLAYENTCFMYDNVRTKDVRLLHRLAHFNVRTDDACFLAVKGLPLRRSVDMSEYLNAARRAIDIAADRDGARQRLNSNEIRRLLPRIIVTSNESVNYLNWAVGTLVELRLNAPRFCMRYRRRIILPNAKSPNTQRQFASDDAYADEHYVIVGMRYRMVHTVSRWPVQIGSRVIVSDIVSHDTISLVTDDDNETSFLVHKMSVRPYEYRSKWNDVPGARIYMFPFVMDVATTVYQVQGLTLDAATYANCYIDARGMDEKSLNVSLSRFQSESQIRGIANPQTLLN